MGCKCITDLINCVGFGRVERKGVAHSHEVCMAKLLDNMMKVKTEEGRPERGRRRIAVRGSEIMIK